MKTESMKKYSWNAEDYKQHSKNQQKWARELIARLKLKGVEYILDIGCGDGKVTAEIASYVPNGSVVGIDNSISMIELAKKNYPAGEHPNLSFILMDATNLTFHEQFDIVFSNASLHWVGNHKLALEGMYRSLKPKGRVFLEMGGKGNADGVLSVLRDLQKNQEWRHFFSDFQLPYGFHGTQEYTQWLMESGFEPVRVELVPKDMEHDGEAGFAGWIRTTWMPFTERIAENQRDQFIHELVSAYIKQVPLDTNGKAHVAMMRLEVEAIKKA
jgi:trans-aconitate 2-methyltransferase